ncbi:MAG: site-specific DNA-methyltransferase [Sulfuricella sp.]
MREAAPQIFSEGEIDLDKLKAALGEHIDLRIERYGLNWAGKSDAFRNVQQLSVGTLLPMLNESVNWDSTENLIIEGDNLEVLKLLQKSYHGKVKMIYIDPPYNTGNEFIYPDNYREGLDDYLRYSGQVSDAGVKQSTNTETSGRFHSNWLSMMYPRLFLARNLLRDDGVIFVSIDDNEVHNLRMLMNEVFGEENFVSVIIVQANKRGQTYKEIAKTHEYLLVYSKGDNAVLHELEKEDDALPFKDSIGAFDLWELRNRNPKFGRFNRPNLFFPIYVAPSVVDERGYAKVSLASSATYSVEVLPRNSAGDDGCWRWGAGKINSYDLDCLSPSLVAKQRRDGEWNIYEKSRKSTTKAKSLWDDTDVISEQGTVQLGSIGLGDIFDHPKPVGLVEKCLRISTQDDDLVLDFFAGSGTTAAAIVDLNKKDGCNRKFILVQLPEKTDNPQYPTIADITRERVRRVIAKLNQTDEGQLKLEGSAKPDRGFRAFKLSSSNFRIWDAAQASTEPDQLALQLQHYTDNVDDSRTRQDILYELILKAGLSLALAAKVEQIKVEGQPVFSVAEGQLLICLENPITQAVLRGMMAREPQQILCLDTAFHGNDPLKTNTVLEARSHGITFRTV